MDALPSTLQSARAKLVYLSLRERGGATVEELANRLDMRKIALFGVLQTLRKRGLVERKRDRYVSI